MRTMVTVTIGAAAGNRAVKDGTLPKVMKEFISNYKPEATYFTTTGGDRTAYFVIDLKDPSQMPPIAEPFFMAFDAHVGFRPVMNADDLGIGLKKAGG